MAGRSGGYVDRGELEKHVELLGRGAKGGVGSEAGGNDHVARGADTAAHGPVAAVRRALGTYNG